MQRQATRRKSCVDACPSRMLWFGSSFTFSSCSRWRTRHKSHTGGYEPGTGLSVEKLRGEIVRTKSSHGLHLCAGLKTSDSRTEGDGKTPQAAVPPQCCPITNGRAPIGDDISRRFNDKRL